ncbi:MULTISPECIES: hypothetical protein [unclassified Curtobacterium]|uniref:hypothetical protein n=1 Tax=unclassified Curtobacterium TaxID=257496 RepID=UPI00203ED6BE|nr:MULTISPECIES: hypothetical protein [unclassified Curtobacterium]MCM3522831.1 hypothetical protein [Curtobacterium sp. P97]MDP9737893.1 hypothetical protein [Curtobacterium sp. 260]
MTDENERPRPEDDAARLGLVVVGEAAALHAGDDASLDASEANIRETVDSMVDEPLTPRQEEVMERLAAAGGTLTAGLSGALAAKTGGQVEDVLEGAARSVVWQQRLAAERDALQGRPQESTDGDPVTDGDPATDSDPVEDQREDAGGQQRHRDDDGRDRG